MAGLVVARSITPVTSEYVLTGMTNRFAPEDHKPETASFPKLIRYSRMEVAPRCQTSSEKMHSTKSMRGYALGLDKIGPTFCP